jgi:hypothetical protein
VEAIMMDPVFLPDPDRSWWRSVRATRSERVRALPGDERIPNALDTITHAITIDRPPREVWPWLVQMGAGSRGGWYSYDALDNGRVESATQIVEELQHPSVGATFPALPGVTDGFKLVAMKEGQWLTLVFPRADGTPDVTWTFVLEPIAPLRTRLIVRVRGGQGYRFHGLPVPITKLAIRFVHYIMERKQLHGLVDRVESSRVATVTPGP